MNDVTLFLAQVLGPILLLVGISLFTRRKFYLKWLQNIQQSEDILFVSSVGELAAGIAIILNHNLWNTLPEIIITLLGWLMIVEGAVFLLAETKSLKGFFASSVLAEGWYIFAVLYTLLGAYVTSLGYLI
jgi:uncharacterized membrane protein